MTENPITHLKNVFENTEIDYPCLMEFETDAIYYLGKGEISWNTDRNLEDLMDGDGNTYGGDLPEGHKEVHGYLFCNVDQHCGQWVTIVFDTKNDVTGEVEDENI